MTVSTSRTLAAVHTGGRRGMPVPGVAALSGVIARLAAIARSVPVVPIGVPVWKNQVAVP